MWLCYKYASREWSTRCIQGCWTNVWYQHMDGLFFLPSCPLALTRAYWLDPDHRIMTSYPMLIEPSIVEFDRIVATIESSNTSDYDMEIVNTIYRDHALILSHRPYALLTGEFRETIHTRYLGNSREVWSPQKALMEAKTVHFSDWPVPIVCLPSVYLTKKSLFGSSCGQNLNSLGLISLQMLWMSISLLVVWMQRVAKWTTVATVTFGLESTMISTSEDR